MLEEVQMTPCSFLGIVCFGTSYPADRAGEGAARFEIEGDIQTFFFERECVFGYLPWSCYAKRCF
jgi:hypothetical protein